MCTESSCNPSRHIRGHPLELSRSRKEWPVWAFNLAANITLAVKAAASPPTGQHVLLIGINYASTPWKNTRLALTQPQYDVKRMKDYFVQKAGLTPSEVTVLSDEPDTPPHLLPTHANIMRETKRLGEGNYLSTFLLYTGHSNQEFPLTSSQALPRGPKATYIIPIDAVVGQSPTDIDRTRLVFGITLHEHLISCLPARSTFLALLDTCHSAHLLDLKHWRCNRSNTWTSLARRSLRRTIVEPLWKVFGRVKGGVENVDSFNISDECNGLCPRRKTPIRPLAVSISACKGHQEVFEGAGPTLTHTFLELLESKPDADLRDFVNSVMHGYKEQRKIFKDWRKQHEKDGNEKKMLEMQDCLDKSRGVEPQLSSTMALDIRRSISATSQSRSLNSLLPTNPRMEDKDSHDKNHLHP